MHYCARQPADEKRRAPVLAHVLAVREDYGGRVGFAARVLILKPLAKSFGKIVAPSDRFWIASPIAPASRSCSCAMAAGRTARRTAICVLLDLILVRLLGRCFFHWDDGGGEVLLGCARWLSWLGSQFALIGRHWRVLYWFAEAVSLWLMHATCEVNVTACR